MKVLFFDTETNGLPKNWRASPYDTASWPRILTLAWQRWEITENSAVLLDKDDYLLSPPSDMVWDSEAETIHHISLSHATLHGKPSSTVLPAFVEIVRSVDLLVAHNVAFDKTVLLCELIRLDPRMNMSWWPRFEYCTCENTKTLCALPPKTAKPNPRDPYKKPKLVELYMHLFPGASAEFPFHSAAGDTECLAQCFLELVKRRTVPLAVWERSLAAI